MESKLLVDLLRIVSLGFVFMMLQSCATFGPKTNSAKVAKVSGEDFVLSLSAENVNFSMLKNGVENNNLLALIPSAQRSVVTKLHQGHRSLTQALQLTDPSRAIATSLAKHYQTNYQLRFIAKGTIKNIDPDYLQRALNKGRYVLDVRLTSLSLVPDNSHTLFYPRASIQMSIIDSQKAKILVEDRCEFADTKNKQRLAALARSNGQLISSFLLKYANDCLNYFAIGKPFSGQPIQSTNQQKQENKPQPKERSVNAQTKASTTAYQVGGVYKLAKDAFDQDLNLQGYRAAVQLIKPVEPGRSLVFQSELAGFQREAWPEPASAVYVASLGIGASFDSEKYSALYYHFLGTVKMGQYRQNMMSISTNSLGLEAQIMKVLFDNIVLTAQYGLDKHIGQTKAANSWGHLFGVSVGFKH